MSSSDDPQDLNVNSFFNFNSAKLIYEDAKIMPTKEVEWKKKKTVQNL